MNVLRVIVFSLTTLAVTGVDVSIAVYNHDRVVLTLSV